MVRARVLLVAPQPFFTVRGTPINVLRMARVLCSAGYEVHLATYPIGETIPIQGLIYHRAPHVPGVRDVAIGFSARKLALDASLALRVWQLQLAYRFDIVHAVEESIFLALPLAIARGTPVIYDLDSVISDQLSYSGSVAHPRVLRGVKALERAAIRRSATAITVCDALTEAVRELEPHARVVQIEDCAESAAYGDTDPSEVEALRRELGVRGPAAVYVGNLEPYQGVDLLVDAWRIVAARCPNAQLVIAGGTPRAVRELEGAIAALGVAHGSIVLTGAQPPERIPLFLAMASVLVSPRRLGDNTPLKLYGYMASGTPIVATNIRSHTQVLDDSTAALASPEPESLADAIVSVLSEPARYRTVGERARARAESRYSEREFARKLLGAYADILEGPNAPVTR